MDIRRHRFRLIYSVISYLLPVVKLGTWRIRIALEYNKLVTIPPKYLWQTHMLHSNSAVFHAYEMSLKSC